MATRLYFTDTARDANDSPSSGEKSTALPIGTSNGGTPTNLFMSTTIGTSQASTTISTLAQTTQQSGVVRRWISNRLTAQTIDANTWTFFSAAAEDNAQANAFTSLSVYVWNPGNSSVRGFVYDNSATLGTKYATSQSAQSVTFSGSAVTISDNDYLVAEWWYNATQGMTINYVVTQYWNGTNDTTTGTGNTSTATYLETPQNLILKTPKSNFVFIM